MQKFQMLISVAGRLFYFLLGTGADVQCDGCGVVYHAQCVDLEDSEPPPCWLCLTCEQLGLRASSSHTDPHHLSRRRGKSR